MSRRHSFKPTEEGDEVNLTPMLDVVFIMLIFFIVTASFVKEAGIDVTRPDSNQQQQESKQPQLRRQRRFPIQQQRPIR